MTCYRRRHYSARFFGGNRDSALERDGRDCRACQARQYLNVPHRRTGDHTQLVTLCAGCHARVHRTRILRRWLPEILVALWREWHPDAVEQLRCRSNCRPPNRRERAGKYSQVFLRESSPTNSRSASWPPKRPKTVGSIATWPRESCT
jgi:hypothetical protein